MERLPVVFVENNRTGEMPEGDSIPVGAGGTGATDPAGARANLGAASAEDLDAHAGRTDNPHDVTASQVANDATGNGSAFGPNLAACLETFADSVNYLSQALNQKAALNHQHPVSEVTGLQAILDATAEDIDDVESLIAATQGAVDDLEALVPTLATSAALSSVADDVETLEGRMDSAEGNITALQGDVAGKAPTSSVTTLAGRVTTAEADIAASAADLDALESRWIYTVAPLGGGGRLVDGDLTLTLSKAGASDSGWLSSADWRSFAGQGDFMVRARATNLAGITAGHVTWTVVANQRPGQSSIAVTNAEKASLQPGAYRMIATIRVTATSQVDVETKIYTGPVGTPTNTDIVESLVRETVWASSTQTLNSVAYIVVPAGTTREVGVYMSRVSGTGTITIVGYSQLSIERSY